MKLLKFLVFLILIPTTSMAFTITGQLTGDIRDESPDNIIIDVTIDVDEVDGKQATWLIDVNSPIHPDIKLKEFYFNLALGDEQLVNFSGYDPYGWEVMSNPVVTGAGGVTFMFGALDPAGQPNADDVTNSQSLSFVMSSNDLFTEATFLNAAISISNDAGSGQMGAHLQSLTMSESDSSDSGFAFGDYEIEEEPPPVVPEPATFLLLGSGLAGIAAARRREKS